MRVFISHASENSKEAQAIKDRFGAWGFNRTFLSSSFKDGMPAGDWWRNLKEEIRRSDLFVFLVSEDWLRSAACVFELHAAEVLGRHVLPISIQTSVGARWNNLQRPLPIYQYYDLSEPNNYDSGLEKIKPQILRIEKTVKRTVWVKAATMVASTIAVFFLGGLIGYLYGGTQARPVPEPASVSCSDENFEKTYFGQSGPHLRLQCLKTYLCKEDNKKFRGLAELSYCPQFEIYSSAISLETRQKIAYYIQFGTKNVQIEGENCSAKDLPKPTDGQCVELASLK